MKKTLSIFAIGAVTLFVLMAFLPSYTADVIKEDTEETSEPIDEYIGLIFIKGRYNSIDRLLWPSNCRFVVYCNRSDITISGLDLYYGGYWPDLYINTFSESNFTELVIPLKLFGFCRFGRIFGVTPYVITRE